MFNNLAIFTAWWAPGPRNIRARKHSAGSPARTRRASAYLVGGKYAPEYLRVLHIRGVAAPPSSSCVQLRVTDFLCQSYLHFQRARQQRFRSQEAQRNRRRRMQRSHRVISGDDPHWSWSRQSQARSVRNVAERIRGQVTSLPDRVRLVVLCTKPALLQRQKRSQISAREP